MTDKIKLYRVGTIHGLETKQLLTGTPQERHWQDGKVFTPELESGYCTEYLLSYGRRANYRNNNCIEPENFECIATFQYGKWLSTEVPISEINPKRYEYFFWYPLVFIEGLER